MNKTITVETTVGRNIETVWKLWNEPEHITHWAFASMDWEAPHAENDLRTGGRFLTRMQAKDGSAGFDFTGTYTNVEPNKRIEYTMDGEDKRTVIITFNSVEDSVHIATTFEMENENSEEMQRSGWQAILNNFKTYAENCDK